MSRRRARAGVAAVVLGALVAPAAALAHARSVSYSRWTLRPEGGAVELRLAQNDLAGAGAITPIPDLAGHAAERLRLARGGRPCRPSVPIVLEATAGWVVLAWSVACEGTGPVALESRLLAEPFPQHLHFARVTGVEGRRTERVLQAADGFVPIGDGRAGPASAGPRATFLRFVALGIEHIGTGWDHLAFVVALLLLAGSVGEVVTLATGFTVAHSVTLVLAVTGLVRPEQQGIEALIGLSIALVAAENVWLVAGRPAAVPAVATTGLLALALAAGRGQGNLDPWVLVAMAVFGWCHFGLLARVSRPARLRVAVAFAFGLVHGFGFAAVLDEMALPPGRMALALGGFNVGVELGQLVVIALAWPLLRVAARARWGGLVTEAGSAALCGFGVFWLVVRTFAR